MSELAPFTLEHFRLWAESLILDSGDPWVLQPFQERFVEDVFSGAPECWLVIPTGNGKTTLVAGLALYHLQFTEWAAVAAAAASRDQAGLMFGQARAFVVRSGLEDVFTCQEGHRRILCRPMNSRIQVFAADDRTGDGIIPTLCIIDELHRHRSLELYRTWVDKLKKRKAQIMVISTAGEPGSEFETTRERMRQVADVEKHETFTRAVDERSVLHDWALPEDGDVEDLELVARANPLGAVTADVLSELRSAPSWNLQHWRRFTCNLPTRSVMAAITEAEWFAARTDEEIPIGESVWVGLDLGWKFDTTAVVPLWIRDPEFRLYGPATILVPPRDGNSLHPDLVKRALVEVHERNPIHTVVMDTSFDGASLVSWVEDELGSYVIDRAQSNSLAVEDYDRFTEALREGWLFHAGDPGLTSHVLNAVARVLPQGDVRFERPVGSRGDARQQDRRVIDALIAAAMVHTSAAVEFASVGEPLVAVG